MKTITEGKWQVHSHAPWSVWCGDVQVASCRWQDEEGYARVCEKMDKAEANARLIAAAPDLLEALERLVNYFGPYQHPELAAKLQDASAAIKKAKGEA